MERHSNICLTNPSILAGVCKGKLSEGYDFKDDLARVVIIVGIPFPDISDPKYIIKKTFYT